jgi:type III secretion protein L
MKFFSFFNKDELHEKAGEKIIPADEIATFLDAKEVLVKAKKDAKEYKEKIKKECEEIKKQSYEDGYNDGLEKLNTTLLKLDHELKNVQDEINKKVLPIALKAAKKILGEELKIHPERIVDIIIQALKPVVQHHKIIIYANKADIELLEKSKSKIKQILEHVQHFSIQERSDIEEGGCIIETEAGIINAQLENQWRALEAAFEKFTKK